MKVLQINSVCGIGSTGRIATDIHQMLVEQGHESSIAYGRGLSMNCDNPIKIGTKCDNYVHVALTRVADKHGFGSKEATVEFIKKIENINPDIIHLHNIHGYYINIKILFDYLRLANKPVVWTLHDCWAITGHCSHFDYIGCEKWKTGCYNCPQKKSYPKSELIDNSKINYNSKQSIFNGINNLTIVTPSEWLAGLIKESYLKDYPIKIINTGVDIDVFKPTPSDFRKKYDVENKFVILGVASDWVEKKGFYHYIDLSKKLEDDKVIILVGVTEKQKRQLPHNIIGITKTNNINELAEIYTAANVFVNLTLEDNFPTVNIEAMACGTPVITYNTGGSIECITSENGLIVERGNWLAILKIVNENNDIFTKNNNIRDYVAEKFNKKEQYKIYLELYDDMLKIEDK